MAAKSSRGPSRKSARGPALTPPMKAAYGDIKTGVRHVEKSIGEVQKGLRKAEKAIEAQAKARIRELRKEAKGQLASLKAKRREAVHLGKNLLAAAEGSWEDVKLSADQALADARAMASAIADRIRTALQT